MVPFDKRGTTLSTLSALGIVDVLPHGWTMDDRAVLFDLDGTLLDSLGDLADAVNAVRTELGLSRLAESEVSHGLGSGLGVLLRACLPARFHHDLSRCREVFLNHYGANLMVRSRPFEGVEALLGDIKCSTGLVTNKPRRFAEPILEHLGWSFDVIVFGDDPLGRKPSAGPILGALARLGVAAENAVYVGDTRVDFLASEAAGVTFLAVPWAHGLEQHKMDRLSDVLLRIGEEA